MAVLTEIVSSAATNEKGFRAAEHTFPSDVVFSMLWARLIADSKSFYLTFLAEEIIFILVLLQIHLFLTVNEASKERLQTAAALVERAAVQGEVKLTIEIIVTFCCQTRILVNAHLVRLIEGFLLNEFSQLFQHVQLLSDRWAVRSFDRLLAAGAIHEGKCDSQGAPLVLEELSDAIGMEDMPALQLDTRLFGELACVANAAKFCLWRQATCQTFRL